MTHVQHDQDRESEAGASNEAASLITDTPSVESNHSPYDSTPPPAQTLRRYPLIVLSTICYAAVAAFSWGVLCVMTYRPIHGSTYGLELNSTKYGEKAPFHNYQDLFVTNERYFRAVRVLQSGISVLTIPLTSAVCSRAAVVFTQRRLAQDASQGGLTLRQTMALADKGWTDPIIIVKLLSGKWRQYGSWFLLLALVLNIIGAVISPLQEIFVSQKTIQTPTYTQQVYGIVDFANHLGGTSPDRGLVYQLVRSRLTSTLYTDVQMRLWSGGDAFGNNATSTVAAVARDQFSLANMSSLYEPFWSQLPAGFSTGLITQYAPRINSTASWENISAEDFPSTCRQDPDALYIRYVNNTYWGGYTAEICMPANMTESPWKLQRSRQDFSEELYLRMNLSKEAILSELDEDYWKPGVHTVRIRMNTSAGYFELPNYRNNLTAGPLLHDAPEQVADSRYHVRQDWLDRSGFRRRAALDEREESEDTLPEGSPSNATEKLSSNYNKGPLNTIALALFGQASFLDITHTGLVTYDMDPLNETNGEFGCVAIVPFFSLLISPEHTTSYSSEWGPCISLDHGRELTDLVKNYLYAFVWNPAPGVIENAFTAAAFIANEAWFIGDYSQTGSVTVNYDFGADTEVPHISRAGMILISILLGLDLAFLLGLALYSVAWMPRWTEHETDGWVGEASTNDDTKAAVGILGLGAKKPIRRGRKYRAYDEVRKSRKDQKRRLE